jgi:molecular chaperone GrpE
MGRSGDSEGDEDEFERIDESERKRDPVEPDESEESEDGTVKDANYGEEGPQEVVAEDEEGKGPVDEGEKREKKIQELTSTLQYVQAEFENFRKRAAKDFQNVVANSNRGLVTRLLPLIDDLEVSLESIEDEKPFAGLKIIHSNFMETLGKEGLEEIKALGETFDPFKHEAVLEVADGEGKEDEIVEVIQKGYMFKSEVLRAPKVKVFKNRIDESQKKTEEKKEGEEREGEQDG